MSLNRVFLHGYLCNVPELRRTNSGKSVVSFTLAVKRDSSNGDTDFITCVAWEKRAEFVNQYFTKGQEAMVVGALNVREYEDKEGIKRKVYEVLVSSMEFCGKKNAAADRDGNERRPEQTFTDYDGREPLPF